MQIVNWGLLKHPLNWITVLLMVFIGGIAFHFIASYVSGKGTSVTPSASTTPSQ